MIRSPSRRPETVFRPYFATNFLTRDDEMSIVEVPATQFPGVPVTQLDSNGFDARGQRLDPISIVRDSASVRFASQRAGLTAVATSAVTVALHLARDLEG